MTRRRIPKMFRTRRWAPQDPKAKPPKAVYRLCFVGDHKECPGVLVSCGCACHFKPKIKT